MKTLFILLDTVRRDALDFYGPSLIQTPNLRRLSERGVTFDNHWAGSLPCMPARRELMTGRYNLLDRGWGPIEPFDDVLPRELRKGGVFTHIATDHDHYFELGGENYHTAFNTWEFFRGQEYDPWASLVDGVATSPTLNRPGSLEQDLANRTRRQNEADYSGPRTAQSAIDWLEANKNARGDWFLQVEMFDPHEPFVCPDSYREIYGDTWDGPLFDCPAPGYVKESPEAIEHIRKSYAALLTMTDVWVGKILDKLESLGQFDETLIVFTTDHGTMLGEHGFWMKNAMPCYSEIARLPLVMKLPGNARAGERVAALTQTIDLMPTFLDFHGCAAPPHVQGHSLRGVLDGETVRADAIFGWFGRALNITDGRHVYMRNPVKPNGEPLHAYTAMPVGGLNQWFSRDLYARIETVRRFEHTYDFPLFKIPVEGHVPLAPPGEASLVGRHQLFDIARDPEQQNPLDDAELETHFCERLREHLRACEAPDEQFTRLGL